MHCWMWGLGMWPNTTLWWRCSYLLLASAHLSELGQLPTTYTRALGMSWQGSRSNVGTLLAHSLVSPANTEPEENQVLAWARANTSNKVSECLARINSVFGTNQLNRCELGISWSDLERKVPFWCWIIYQHVYLYLCSIKRHLSMHVTVKCVTKQFQIWANPANCPHL